MNIVTELAQHSLLPINRKLDFGDDDYVASYERGGRQSVYVSKRAAICLGEYCIDTFSDCELQERVVFVLKIETQKFYGAAVENGKLTVEFLGDLEFIKQSLLVELDLFGLVVSNDKELVNLDIYKGRGYLWSNFDLSNVSSDYWTSLDLVNERKDKRKKINNLIIIVVLLGLISFGFANIELGEKPVTVRYVDPYASYVSDIESQTEASYALNQAANMYAMMLTLPAGYNFTEIKNNGVRLEGSFSKSDVKLSVFEAWLTPSYREYWDGEFIFLNMEGVHGNWNKELYPINDVGLYTHDMLLDIGASDVELSDLTNVGGYAQQTITFKFTNKPFGLVTLVSDLVARYPWFLTSLKMVPNKNDGVFSDVEIGLTLKGKQE